MPTRPACLTAWGSEPWSFERRCSSAFCGYDASIAESLHIGFHVEEEGSVRILRTRDGTTYFGASKIRGPCLGVPIPGPNVPLLRALWSLLDGIWGILKGSSRVLVMRIIVYFEGNCF